MLGHVKLTTQKVDGVVIPVIKRRMMGERGWKTALRFPLSYLVPPPGCEDWPSEWINGYNKVERTFDEAMAKADLMYAWMTCSTGKWLPAE